MREFSQEVRYIGFFCFILHCFNLSDFLTSRICRSDSPTYMFINSGPLTDKKLMPHSVATAFASNVFPVPALNSSYILWAKLIFFVHLFIFEYTIWSISRKMWPPNLHRGRIDNFCCITWGPIQQNSRSPPQPSSKKLRIFEGKLNCSVQAWCIRRHSQHKMQNNLHKLLFMLTTLVTTPVRHQQ